LERNRETATIADEIDLYTFPGHGIKKGVMPHAHVIQSRGVSIRTDDGGTPASNDSIAFMRRSS
jgi:hypothetical protein